MIPDRLKQEQQTARKKRDRSYPNVIDVLLDDMEELAIMSPQEIQRYSGTR
jgi:hypothetical protein